MERLLISSSDQNYSAIVNVEDTNLARRNETAITTTVWTSGENLRFFLRFN